MTNPRHLQRLAELLHSRNEIDDEIAGLLGRPPTTGALGEFVAAAVFDIVLEHSAVSKGIDGRFRSGPLAGMTVDVKCYGKHEGLLDLPTHDLLPDMHLVLAGPKGAAASSRGTTRPWRIDFVFLFETPRLIEALLQRGVKIGTATSVAAPFWTEAEVYPEARSGLVALTPEQRELLSLFARPVGRS